MTKSRSMMPSLKKAVLMLGTVILTTLVSYVPVAAQTCEGCNGQTADYSGYGTLRLQAATNRGYPGSPEILQVNAKIWSLPTACTYGAYGSTGCHDEAETNNAVVSAFAVGCGSWIGWSQHGYRPYAGASTVMIEDPRWTELFSSGCRIRQEEECEEWEIWDEQTQSCIPYNTPVVINTGGDQKYEFTSSDGGVLFDIDGDGDLDQVAWTETDSDTAFLVRDVDGDGRITSGKELFGNHTIAGASNGFDALALLAEKAIGRRTPWVDASNPLFAQLLLWTDRNHNGVSEAGELRPVSDVLYAIANAYQIHQRKDGHGNAYRFRGWVYTKAGNPGKHPILDEAEEKLRKRFIYDVVFVTR